MDEKVVSGCGESRGSSISTGKGKAKGRPKKKVGAPKAPRGLSSEEVEAICEHMKSNCVNAETAAAMLEIPEQKLKDTMTRSRSAQANEHKLKIKGAHAQVVSTLAKNAAPRHSLELLKAFDSSYTEKKDEEYVRRHLIAFVKVIYDAYNDKLINRKALDTILDRLSQLNGNTVTILENMGFNGDFILR